MAIFSFKAEQREGGFEGYELGEHLAQIVIIDTKVSSTGKDYYQFTLKGETFGTYNHRLFDTAFGRNEFFQILTALGIDTKRDDIDSDELTGSYIIIDIQHDKDRDGTIRTYNDKPQYRIASFKTADTQVGGDDEDDDEWDA